MPTNLSETKKFRRKCWERAESFPVLIPPNSQIEAVSREPHTLSTHLAALQVFLQNAASELLYGSSCSVQLLMQSRLPTFSLDVGLISVMEMSGPAIADRGIPIYEFLLGTDAMWNAYLSNKCDAATPLAQVKNELAHGVALPQRLFGHRNATGALLSPTPPAGIDPLRRVAIPHAHSDGGVAGTGSAFAGTHPWALVSDRSFPMLYAIIPRDTSPLGFFQIHVALPDTVAGDKYTGPESTWLHIYDSTRPWSRDLATFVAAFCEILLAPVIDRAIRLRDHAAHAVETHFCFPEDFRKAVRLRDTDAPWDPGTYGGSKWAQQIAHLHSLWREPAFPPAELAKNLIDLFWSVDTWRHLPAFDKRSEAEKLLFWSEKYRDHLVHILKVFLIGERMILELHHNSPQARSVINNTPICDGATTPLEAFEFQWMLAATVHDYSLPYELLPGLQRSYWSEFVVPEDGYKTGEDAAIHDLEAMQFGLTLADRILRQHLVVSLWQVLHSEVMPQGRDSYPAYCDLHQLGTSERRIVYPRFLSYFLEHGDHGIASALWFLHLTMLHRSPDGKVMGLNSPLAAGGELKCRESIAVARACYFHNLATKRVKTEGGDLGDPYFAGDLFGPFDTDPLAYLLLLADFLQDEGRDESEEPSRDVSNAYGKRPFGHVTDIKWHAEFLEIHVEYAWVHRGENGVAITRVPLGDNGCKTNTNVKCHRRHNLKAGEPTCWQGTCKECKDIAEAFVLLADRLAGLPVKVYLAHETKGPIEL